MPLKFNSHDSPQTFESFSIERSHLTFKLDKKDIVAELVMKETLNRYHCTLCLNVNGKEFVIYKTSTELVSAIVAAVSETKLILRRRRMRMSNLRKERINKLQEQYISKATEIDHKSFYNFSLN